MLLTKKDITRFHTKYVLINDCWEWVGRLDPQGYGLFDIKRSPYFAHRISYLIHKGKYDEELCISTRCRNRACVNPNHLILTTKSEIIASYDYAIGEKQGNSTLTEAQVKEIRFKSGLGLTPTELSKEYKVSKMTIHSIVTRKTWRHI